MKSSILVVAAWTFIVFNGILPSQFKGTQKQIAAQTQPQAQSKLAKLITAFSSRIQSARQ
ncbi:MAG: hypothetical protein JNL01_02510 [Bdellovibrionales bacterium]|nr:hypothetical protein [Bdellovibrionales bacterium]